MVMWLILLIRGSLTDLMLLPLSLQGGLYVEMRAQAGDQRATLARSGADFAWPRVIKEESLQEPSG